MKPGVALPAEGRPRLDRDAQDLAVADIGQDVLAIIARLGVEALGAGHGDNVGADPLRFKQRGRVERDLDLRAGRDENDFARVFSGFQAIGATRARFSLTASVLTGRKFCRVSARIDGSSLCSASAQHSAVSTASAGR